jgi:cysteine desulfurase
MSGLYVAASDHPCILAGGRFGDAARHVMPVDGNGVIDLDALDAALGGHDRSAGTALVATHWANNETGVIQPVDKIGAIARRHGAMVVIDAVQAAGRVPIDLETLDADYLIVSAHKLGGPKGVGALIAKSDLVMPMPLIAGGGQERGHRSGTEGISAIAGFGAACTHAGDHIEAFAALGDVRDRLIAQLRKAAPGLVLHGESAPRLTNTIYVSLPGKKAETMQIALDLEGFAVSSGSACSSGKVGKSHVLEAMAFAGDEGAIRISFSPDVASEAIDEFAETFGVIAAR